MKTAPAPSSFELELRITRTRYQLGAFAVLAVLLVGLALLIPSPNRSSPVQTPSMNSVMDAYARGDYVGAHSELLFVARVGQAEAQEFLGVMYAVGASVYPGVSMDVQAATFWLEQAVANGRPSALYLKCALQHGSATPAQIECLKAGPPLDSTR